ncbi:MAG: HlyC/CorC family transporter [Chloroflexi bacterium]|nr:HlyC/CorC family transporter [Chloroflexota bacterium]
MSTDSNLAIQVALVVIFIILNAFFAASEIAIISVRKTRIKQLAEEQKHSGAQAVLRLTENPSRFLATIQVGVTLAGFFASAIGAISAVAMVDSLLSVLPIPVIAQASGPVAVALVTLSVAFFTLVFGELVPKNLAVTYAERIAFLVARPIEFLALLLTPLVALLTLVTNLILAGLGSKETAQMPEMTEDEIRSIIEAGEEGGVVEPMELKMIQGVFDFGDTVVREIMVPRIDIIAIPKQATIEDALDVFLQAGFTRMPVYDRTLDNIVGTLHAKDFLKHFGGRVRAETVDALMRPAFFVPETKKVSELFTELQHRRTHMAVVVDEYGGTAGLVTLEDMVEEIVGEIHDEYDTMERQIEPIGPNEVVTSGKVTLDELNDVLDLALSGEGEYDTVGGLIYAKLGRIPSPGDRVAVDGVTLTVLAVQGRRIRHVRVVKEEIA